MSGREPLRWVHRRYLRELTAGLVAYLLLLIGAISVLRRGWLESIVWRAVVAMLPVLALIWIFSAMLRVIRGQDELERRIDLEAIAIGAALTGLGYFSAGMLMGANVLPPMSADAVAIWVLPSLFAGFGVAKCLVVLRRYHRA